MSAAGTAASPGPRSRPQVLLVLAVSLDGRLAPPSGGAAQLGGAGDRRALEEALAWADGCLIGAQTLRLHGTTCLIRQADLLERRRLQGRPPQPWALAVSRSGRLDPQLPFFRQPLRRGLVASAPVDPHPPAGFDRLWLLSPEPSEPEPGPPGDQEPGGPASGAGAAAWGPFPRSPGDSTPAWPRQHRPSPAEPSQDPPPAAGWTDLLAQLAAEGLDRLVLLGGARLAASLLALDLVDGLQLTLVPHLLGGAHSWMPPAPLPAAVPWQLQESRSLGQGEVLLRYGRPPAPQGP